MIEQLLTLAREAERPGCSMDTSRVIAEVLRKLAEVLREGDNAKA